MVTADGRGIVSNAGLVLLRGLADKTGLTGGLSKALATPRVLVHDRGRVLADLAAAIAGGAGVISDFRVLADQKELTYSVGWELGARERAAIGLVPAARGRSRSARPGRSANAAPMTAGRCPCGSSPAASGPIPARTVFTPGLRTGEGSAPAKTPGSAISPPGDAAGAWLIVTFIAATLLAWLAHLALGQPHRRRLDPHQRPAASTLTSARPSQRPRKEAPGNAVSCLAR
jgi:hypothetical protein